MLRIIIFLLTSLLLCISCSKNNTSENSEEIKVEDLILSGPVHAGNDKTVTLPKVSLTLTGATSNQQNTTLFLWEKISGAEVTIASPLSLSTKIFGLKAGTYVFKLTRTDGGQSLSDEIFVMVKPAPIARLNSNSRMNKII